MFKRRYSELAPHVHPDERTQRQAIEDARAALAQGTLSKKQRAQQRKDGKGQGAAESGLTHH